MDPNAVLADLLDVSGQVESAIVVEHAGGVVGSTIADEERTRAFERAVRDLIAAAQSAPGSGREPLTQLRVTLEHGCVFAVQDDTRIAAAVTVPFPTPGLVFYDLKNCLRQISGDARAPQPAPWDGSEGEG